MCFGLWDIRNQTSFMKTTLRAFSALALGISLVFYACKKEADSSQTNNSDNTTEVKGHSDDQSRVSGDLDDVATDADAVLEGNVSFSGRYLNGANVMGDVCGATAVADTTGGTKTITLTYNGNNCQGTTYRTGTVLLSMPRDVKWKNAGAAITVTLQNLKIKRLSDNKSVTINGTQIVTNVNGGLVRTLSGQQIVVHTTTSSNMSITFDDTTQRTWQVARKRTFTYNNGIVLTVTGIGTSGSLTNVAEWGTNRYGHAFTTSITSPLIFRQDCSGRLTSGEIKHEGFATATATFGLNAAGQATTCPGTGNYYYRLSWTGPAGNSASVILPY